MQKEKEIKKKGKKVVDGIRVFWDEDDLWGYAAPDDPLRLSSWRPQPDAAVPAAHRHAVVAARHRVRVAAQSLQAPEQRGAAGCAGQRRLVGRGSDGDGPTLLTRVMRASPAHQSHYFNLFGINMCPGKMIKHICTKYQLYVDLYYLWISNNTNNNSHLILIAMPYINIWNNP
jgi:hypothetical protein